MRIFATDLDGTLLDRDGGVHPRDAAAIVSAQAEGVLVTIATGRLTSGALPTATALGLVTPLVCADGSILACSTSHDVLERRGIAAEDVERVLRANEELGLASFVFTAGEIMSCRRGVPHHPYVATWSPAITTHADVLGADAWRAHPEAAVMVLGIGEPEAVDRLVETMAHQVPSLDVLAFFVKFGRHRVARFIARGVDKAAGLTALARRLGVGPEAFGVVGDWHNDLPMFGWAARSYAMPHAPDDVKAAASSVVGEGGVAEAIARFLDETST